MGVVECWVSDASLHYSITPLLQFLLRVKRMAQSVLFFSMPLVLCTRRFV
jgi:hypothetical protein